MPIIKLEGNRGFSLSDTGGLVLNSSATANPETTMFSQVIGAGKMGSSKILNFSAILHITSGALTVPNLTIKLKLGSSVLTLTTAAALSVGILDKPIIIEGSIANFANNQQFVVAKVFNNSGGLILSGLGSTLQITDGTWAVDTTVDQTFAITAQFGGLFTGTSITTKLVQINLT